MHIISIFLLHCYLLIPPLLSQFYGIPFTFGQFVLFCHYYFAPALIHAVPQGPLAPGPLSNNIVFQAPWNEETFKSLITTSDTLPRVFLRTYTTLDSVKLCFKFERLQNAIRLIKILLFDRAYIFFDEDNIQDYA